MTEASYREALRESMMQCADDHFAKFQELLTMTFIATKAPVEQGRHARGTPPDAFLAELVRWAAKADDRIFASRPDDRGETDIYTSVAEKLGPWMGTSTPGDATRALHRKAVMLEVLRVLAGFESTWHWPEGKDVTNPAETDAETMSAGPWQISYNSRGFGADLRALLVAHGIGNGSDFQDQMKTNHPFAMEYTARLLRHTIRHNGPVKRGEIHHWLSREAVTEFMALLSC